MIRRILDRVVLVVIAVGVLAGGLWLEIRAHDLGIGSDWQAFAYFTVFWFGVIGYLCAQWSRGRRLYRRWPILCTYLGLLVLHCTLLGLIIERFHPNWNALGWIIAWTIELPIMLIVLRVAYDYSTSPTPMSFAEFRRHILDKGRFL